MDEKNRPPKRIIVVPKAPASSEEAVKQMLEIEIDRLATVQKSRALNKQEVETLSSLAKTLSELQKQPDESDELSLLPLKKLVKRAMKACRDIKKHLKNQQDSKE
ncbi:MAG: hypothetical protein LLG04_07285 [Parachlamydia sp.]|nr:hypothetical protein [Parachlamydia sp.]